MQPGSILAYGERVCKVNAPEYSDNEDSKHRHRHLVLLLLISYVIIINMKYELERSSHAVYAELFSVTC